MSLMSPITCALGRCRPTRESYRWDPQSYSHIGVCRHCERPVRRVAHRTWERVPDQGKAAARDWLFEAKDELANYTIYQEGDLSVLLIQDANERHALSIARPKPKEQLAVMTLISQQQFFSGLSQKLATKLNEKDPWTSRHWTRSYRKGLHHYRVSLGESGLGRLAKGRALRMRDAKPDTDNDPMTLRVVRRFSLGGEARERAFNEFESVCRS